MKKVFIKYNPYKLETEITVNGDDLKEDSVIRSESGEGSRLQEWVEDLPRLLFEEFADTGFEIEFHGTALDYEDVLSVVEDVKEVVADGGKRKLNITVKERIPAKETSDKEALIEKVFADIQKGPFDELRDKSVTRAFEQARSGELEVCVVATMSAGKSTLINAMLGVKLMPSKQEACTAIITKIKDVDAMGKDFRFEAYDENDTMLGESDKMTLNYMEVFNSCPVKYKCAKRNECPAPGNPEEQCTHFDKNIPKVRTVCLFGDIPFVKSDDVSLVLIDTPGPNNARNDAHKEVQSKLLDNSSKPLILYIMTGEYATHDDNELLRRVAESMRVRGKQSKDRFLFVVNKLDTRKKEDGNLDGTLAKVADYLSTKREIYNPNIFPMAAGPALDIRLHKNGDKDSIDEEEVEHLIKKFNKERKEGDVDFHFDKYSSLPKSIKNDIRAQLDEARKRGDKAEEAVIHTGIVSLEAAIRQYVQKYAKTAKIKNLVDTFMKKLEELGCFETLKSNIAADKENAKKILAQIAAIEKKMDSAKEAKKFKEKVADVIDEVKADASAKKDETVGKFQGRITEEIGKACGQIDLDAVDGEVEKLKKFAKELELDFEVELDEVIKNNLVKTGKQLLDEYKEKLKSLKDEITLTDDFEIDSLKLMSGSVSGIDISSKGMVKGMVKTEKVKDGEEYVVNTDKAWYKPWTWWDEKGYYRDKYKTKEFIVLSELAQQLFMPLEDCFRANGVAAEKYAIQQSKRIAKKFEDEFKRLDDMLKEKLNELKSYATDKEKAEARIEESERKLKWLEEIKGEVESILEI